MKPRLKIVEGQPVVLAPAISAIDRARQRHGKPFAHEPGSDFKPHEIPVLTRWMQQGGEKREWAKVAYQFADAMLKERAK